VGNLWQALKQQQQEMLATQRELMRQQQEMLREQQGGGSSSSASAAAAGVLPGMAGLPGLEGLEGMDPEQAAALMMSQGAGFGGAGGELPDYLAGIPPEAAAEMLAGLTEEQYREMFGSGQVPVLMGEGGRQVVGPHGQPVVLAQDGRAVMLGPQGQASPYGMS
jgi:hypothetical protein